MAFSEGDLVVATIYTNAEKSAFTTELARVRRILPDGSGAVVRVVGLNHKSPYWGMALPLKWEQLSE